jgi:hypothetical protein
MLDRAKFLVVSEITEVLGEKTPQVEVKVDSALERCFAVKARERSAREGQQCQPAREVAPQLHALRRIGAPRGRPKPTRRLDASFAVGAGASV